MLVPDNLQRTALLYGAEAIERLGRTRVILFGVGGVGSWCAEALIRTGIGHLTMVDADDVDSTNINRQLPALSTTVGKPKAQVLQQRFEQINPDADIRAIKAYYSDETADDFQLSDYDIVIDAIDSLKSKALLMLRATSESGVTFFSSMGAARRTDPSRVSSTEFWKVRGCPLARALRDHFKRTGQKPRRKFKCVYSEEAIKGEPKGTSMAVTATFGLHLAALAIDAALSKEPKAIGLPDHSKT